MQFIYSSFVCILYFSLLVFLFGFSFSFQKSIIEMICWPFYMSQFCLLSYFYYGNQSSYSDGDNDDDDKKMKKLTNFQHLLFLKNNNEKYHDTTYYQTLIYCMYFGNWLGCFVIPLDWNELWQVIITFE